MMQYDFLHSSDALIYSISILGLTLKGMQHHDKTSQKESNLYVQTVNSKFTAFMIQNTTSSNGSL